MPRTSPVISVEKSAGFTLVELLIAIILSGVVVTIFVSALLTMVSTAILQKTQLELSQQNQIALDVIERDIRVSLGFATTIPSTTPASFVDNYGPTNTNEDWSGTWSYKGTGDANYRVLILKETATTTNPLRATRSPIYVNGALSNLYAPTDSNLNCTVYNASTSPTGALTYNPKLPYYLVYFVRDNTLYRRTLTDTRSALCNSPQYQKQSCPAIDSTRPATCLANDELIAHHVVGFTATYYRQDDKAVATDVNAYASSDPTIFSEVGNVLVTLQLQKTVSGESRSSTLSVRVSQVN